VLLEKLGPQEKQPKLKLPWQQVEDALATTVLSMAIHSEKDHFAVIQDTTLVSVIEDV